MSGLSDIEKRRMRNAGAQKAQKRERAKAEREKQLKARADSKASGELRAPRADGKLTPRRAAHAKSAARLTVLAGMGGRVTDGFVGGGFADGQGEEAAFHCPRGIKLEPSGRTLLVCDHMNHALRRVSLGDRTTTTIAGSPPRDLAALELAGKAPEVGERERERERESKKRRRRRRRPRARVSRPVFHARRASSSSPPPLAVSL